MKMFLHVPAFARRAPRLAALGLVVFVAAAPVAVAKPPALDRDELTSRLVPVTGEPRRSVDLTVPFARNSAKLTATAKEQLDELGAALAGKRLKSYDVGVYGHTDASGKAAYNQKLSEQRAAAVVRYLVRRLSLEPKRFRHAGYGEERLLEGIDANSPRHRRVEVEVFARASRTTPETRVASEPRSNPEPPSPSSAAPALAAARAPGGGQAPVDEYEMLSAEAGRQQVEVLVTGWHPVTGEETEMKTAAEGGPVAVTGDRFVKAVDDGGNVSEVRRYENLPLIAMKVDAAALAAAKGYDAGVRIWRDLPVEPFLDDSGPIVGADKAHRGGYTGKGTFVAVVDSGVDMNHPFLAGRPALEACFSRQCPNGEQRMVGPGAARPISRHGTHVAGIVLGRGAEMSGVAPEAGLIVINVFYRTDDGRTSAKNSMILAALDWLIGVARTGRVRIASVNMSLGGRTQYATPCRSRGYELAARLLARENVALVAASGNAGQSRGISSPACVDGIISVGAIDKDAEVAGFSNSAPILDILAPGVGILSAVPRSRENGAPFRELRGTSMAAPHVAGAFAVMRQVSPEGSFRELYRALVRGGNEIIDERNGVRKPSLNVAGALATLGKRVAEHDQRPAAGGAPASAPRSREGIWQPIGE